MCVVHAYWGRGPCSHDGHCPVVLRGQVAPDEEERRPVVDVAQIDGVVIVQDRGHADALLGKSLQRGFVAGDGLGIGAIHETFDLVDVVCLEA